MSYTYTIEPQFISKEECDTILNFSLENLELIQNKRLEIWNNYFKRLKDWVAIKGFLLPTIPDYSTNNAHIFYIVLPNIEIRDLFISYLRENKIHAVFHYQQLHQSSFYLEKNENICLEKANIFSNCLVRLPIYYDLDYEHVISKVLLF